MMTRPVAALLITILLFAGVYGYTTFVDSVRRPPLKVQENFAVGDYSVRITRTFDCVGDADFDIDALVVRFRGEDLVRRTDTVRQSEVIHINPLKNVVQLDNELYVFANHPSEDANGTNDDWDLPKQEESSLQPAQTENRNEPLLEAVRIQVMRGQRTLTDETIWQEPGSKSISGSVSFDTTLDQADPQDHDQ